METFTVDLTGKPTLGSSILNVPFGFPSRKIAKSMQGSSPGTTSERVKSLAVLYWDGIDEKIVFPLNRDMKRRVEVLNFLVGKGISKGEASGFIAGMLNYPSWWEPGWSLTKTLIQEVTSTGRQGGGSKAFDWAKILKTPLYIGAGVLALYLIVPKLILGRKKK